MNLSLLILVNCICFFSLNIYDVTFANKLLDNKKHVVSSTLKNQHTHNNLVHKIKLQQLDRSTKNSVNIAKVGAYTSAKVTVSTKIVNSKRVEGTKTSLEKVEKQHTKNQLDKKVVGKHQELISAHHSPFFKVDAKLFITSSDLDKFTSSKNHRNNIKHQISVPSGDTMDKAGKTYLCPSGHFSSVGGGCEPCFAGTFSEAGSSKCSLCGKGSYSDSMGQASCTPCPSGLFNPKEGGRDSKICQKCPPGYACESEQLGSPKPCGSGKYSPLGTMACKSCPTFFSPDSVQSSCKAKTSFYVATSSLSFAFFSLIGIMAGRIKKATKSLDSTTDGSDYDHDEIISFEGIYGYTIDQDDFKVAVNRATTSSVDYGII